MTLRAYLDNNATTALSPEAFEAMRPHLTELFLNPTSAAAEVRGDPDPAAEARRALAVALGDETMASEFVLTSGASESNSWAVQCGRRAGGHMVTSRIEHPSLRLAVEAAERRGAEVSFVSCNHQGVVTADAIEAVVRPDTTFVSVMLANNETGVIQPLAEIAAKVHRVAPGALIHTDATQALGRMPVDLAGALAEIDLLSLSAHKFHGPRGVGALFIREGVALEPLIYGQQDGGRRGGTSNGAGAAGLATATRAIAGTLEAMGRVKELRDRLEARAAALWPGTWVNGAGTERLPNTSSITFPGIVADDVVDALALEGVCVASGSACDSGSTAPSAVLSAMGLSYDHAKATLRFSLSVMTELAEVDAALDALEHALSRARFVDST